MSGIVSAKKVTVIICVREATTEAIQYQQPGRLGPNICYMSLFLPQVLDELSSEPYQKCMVIASSDLLAFTYFQKWLYFGDTRF